jgi:acetyl-CoA carboxylase biotin carboxyl carrier protein
LVKIDYEALSEFIALSKEYELDELEVKHQDFKIALKRTSRAAPASKPASEAVPAQHDVEVLDVKNLIPVKAPLTGVFYRAPRPNVPAFVEIGEEVEVGQVLCIVEAMKLMNEITSEIKGKIIKVMVDNSAVVKADQILFYLEKV